MSGRADLVLSVLLCTVDPHSGAIHRDRCVHACEVVAHAGECAERLAEIMDALPPHVRRASFPECYRPKKGCRQ